MPSKKLKQKTNCLKPKRPPKPEDPDQDFKNDLEQLEQLQKMTQDMITMEQFIKLQLQFQQETIKQNYWDLVQLLAYKGLCMTRHVAEQRLQSSQPRPNPPRILPTTRPQRQPLNVGQHHQNLSGDLQFIRINNVLTVEHIHGNHLQSQTQSDSLSQISLSQISHQASVGSEDQPRGPTRQQQTHINTAFLEALFGNCHSPICQAEPVLFARLMSDQQLMTSILHEFNSLFNNQKFTRLYIYFLLNQQHQGFNTNVEHILYDPIYNPNAANETIREMFREMDLEEILRNLVRGDNSRRNQSRNQTQKKLKHNQGQQAQEYKQKREYLRSQRQQEKQEKNSQKQEKNQRNN